MRFLVDFTLSENDKRLLIVLLCILVLLFIIVGLIGVLIRFVTIRFSKRMDYEVHEAVVYRVISSPEQLRKYGDEKNNRFLIKTSLIPFFIGLFSLLIWIIYSAVYHSWARNYFGEFSTLLVNFDWGNPDNYAVFWGINLLRQWPAVVSTPTWVGEFWGSYLLVPLWLTAIIWYAVVIQAYIARAIRLNRLCHSIFEKSLEDFNYFEDDKIQGEGKENPQQASQQQNPPNYPNNPNYPH